MQGFIIELMGNPITIVQITKSIGYVERNIAEMKTHPAGNQQRILDVVIITSWISKGTSEFCLDLWIFF